VSLHTQQLRGFYDFRNDYKIIRSRRCSSIFFRIERAEINTTASQVKLLITNNAFCIVQRATAQSKSNSRITLSARIIFHFSNVQKNGANIKKIYRSNGGEDNLNKSFSGRTSKVWTLPTCRIDSV
jgi:hypothetical protein